LASTIAHEGAKAVIDAYRDIALQPVDIARAVRHVTEAPGIGRYDGDYDSTHGFGQLRERASLNCLRIWRYIDRSVMKNVQCQSLGTSRRNDVLIRFNARTHTYTHTLSLSLLYTGSNVTCFVEFLLHVALIRIESNETLETSDVWCGRGCSSKEVLVEKRGDTC
jgi:hypothetical protein